MKLRVLGTQPSLTLQVPLRLELAVGCFSDQLLVHLQVRREPSPPIPTLQRKLVQPQCSARPPTADTRPPPAPPSAVRLKLTCSPYLLLTDTVNLLCRSKQFIDPVM